jgi:multiple sugar transport system permease protein
LNYYRLKKQSTAALASLARYLILIAFAYILFYPFLFMVINSAKNTADWLDPTVQWVPKEFTFDNVIAAGQVLKYGTSFISTLINGIVPAIISFFSCAVAGYGLARFDFKGKKFLVGVMILLILIPDPMLMVASYDNFRHFDFLGILKGISQLVGVDIRPNFIDTPLAFWLPALMGTGLKNGLFIYIYMQFFKGLPKELEEASWIDGAGPWQTFLKIVLPSSGAAAVTVLVFAVVWYYNDYYQSQLFISENFTLSVMLANFKANISSNLSKEFTLSTGALLTAASFVTILPMLAYFLVMQRKFVQSIATCGIVG